MAIGPVDYQILMPKVNETARVQSELQQKILAQAQQKVENSDKSAEHDTKTVHSQAEAQKLAIGEDEKSKGGHQGQGKKKNAEDDQDETEERGLLPQERTTIDIRI